MCSSYACEKETVFQEVGRIVDGLRYLKRCLQADSLNVFHLLVISPFTCIFLSPAPTKSLAQATFYGHLFFSCLSPIIETQVCNIFTRSLRFADHVIGAWIAKRRSPKNQSNTGQLVGFTLFTFDKAGGRKLKEERVTFECEDESVCEAWIGRINDIIQS